VRSDVYHTLVAKEMGKKKLGKDCAIMDAVEDYRGNNFSNGKGVGGENRDQ